MGMWASLLIGILAGVIVAIFVAIVRSAFLGKLKYFHKIAPAKLRKSLSWEYKNSKKAERSIAKDMKTTTTMRVFCLKGATFCNQYQSADKTPYRILHERNSLITQMYLISDPSNPYIETRAPEIQSSSADLRRGIETSIQHIERETVRLPETVQLRKHMEAVRLRLYIFDENLYLSYQPVNVEGKDCSVQKYPKDSDGYTALEAYFEELWEKYEGSN